MRDNMQIKIQRRTIEDAWNEFRQIHAAIEESENMDKNENEHYLYREVFDDFRFKSVAKVVNK